MPVQQFTYGFDPATTTLDAVRFLVGDIDEARPMLDDREVNYAIAKHPNEQLAAALLADALEARFAREADVSVGQVRKSFSQVSEAFREKAKQLREEALKRASVSFPATIVTEKQRLEEDTNLTQPQFKIGLLDNPFALQLNKTLSAINWYGF